MLVDQILLATKGSRFVVMDSDDEDEQGLQQDEDSKDKDQGKEVDDDDKEGHETPVTLADPSKGSSSGPVLLSNVRSSACLRGNRLLKKSGEKKSGV